MPKAAKLEGGKAAKPDEKIRREMKEVDDEAQNLAVKYRAPDQVQIRNPDQVGLGHKFPARLTAYDPADDLEEMKLNAPKEFGHKMLEREDLEWMRRKKQNVQYADFVEWAETYFDMRNPAEQRIVEEIIPDYFERREEQIEEVADLQKRIAKLRLMGPRTKDDLFLIYLLANGKVEVPAGPVWNPEEWYPNKNLASAEHFTRGMFNPRRMMASPSVKGKYEKRWDWMNPFVFGTDAEDKQTMTRNAIDQFKVSRDRAGDGKFKWPSA